MHFTCNSHTFVSDLKTFLTMKLRYPSFEELKSGLIGLFYPELCVACGEEHAAPQHCFCLSCMTTLPGSDMYLRRENEVVQRFWGRLPLVFGASRYFFTRKNPIQRAIYNLKYKNQPEIGIQMGREFGRKLRQADWHENLDAIIPVPLHPRKERLRGYNQSAVFAQGLAQSLELPVYQDVLMKKLVTQTQTRKKRLDRYGNVEEAFALKRSESVAGKHVLLVDDVLTTGATLESCGQHLLNIPGLKLSVATIAIRMY